jgi:hypothetical protein
VTILRRALITLLAAAAVVAVVPVAALGSAQQVIEDYQDDGQIQGCYSAQDFNRAVDELDPQAGIYEQARDIIRAAQLRCAKEGGGDDGGSGAGIWIGIVVAVGLVALGAGALARRRGREDGGGGTGGDGA